MQTEIQCLKTVLIDYGCDHQSPQRPVFQNTKSFLIKSLYLEPPVKRPSLVSDRDHF